MDIKDKQLKLIEKILKTRDEALLDRVEELFNYTFPNESILTEEQYDKIEERHQNYMKGKTSPVEWEKARRTLKK